LNGKFLLAHNHSWLEGTISMITGFVDALESSTVNFLGHYMFKEANQLIIAYHIIAKGTVSLNEELSDYKLVSKESLEAYNFEPFYITQKVVKDFITRNP
jgi:NAD+ diphosphatase